MHNFPQAIAGTKEAINADIALSILLDRTLVIELARNTIVLFSPHEVTTVYDYLLRHMNLFHNQGGRNHEKY